MRRRARLITHPALWFVIGVLFGGQLPGEPLHDRVWLVALLLLAVLAGRLWESMRVGGGIDRQVQDALGPGGSQVPVGEPCVICGNSSQPRRRGQGNTVVCIDSECCDWQAAQTEQAGAAS